MLSTRILVAGPVNIVGAMTTGASVSVTIHRTDGKGVFAVPEGSYTITESDKAKFSSDVSTLSVVLNNSGNLELTDAAAVTEYPLWVGGTRVTSANASDVFNDGKVSYTPATTGENATPAVLNHNPGSEPVEITIKVK